MTNHRPKWYKGFLRSKRCFFLFFDDFLFFKQFIENFIKNFEKHF